MWELSFTEDLSKFRQIYLKIQALVGLVMDLTSNARATLP
ncbi:hypothetical protein LEP1GSC036_0524 [Leptospira weilii str. 2006001853]|uniref:Uncharacterized protein n=2 Tax=Leptospira weilii TaxID=28184 RepID=A0A828Z3J4_9LEPT|nr:hypothetical protein LEP1GSC036_0524 [Leptospira weilii str. 2006001853]EMJ63204.1 hypothetical protein LEP1GSC051_1402 [Leptospira sp. P2653]EMN89139.1 hypothetical protein LEP1GSC108_0126 [Leptospira weilii str. UI 13098]